MASSSASKPEGSNRAYLKARTSKVSGIDNKVGTSEVIADSSPSITDGVTKSGVGWHCKVCDCYLKDSLGYLDHINGKKHQRALGFTMRVEQSTVGGIKGKLEEMRRRKITQGVGSKKKKNNEGGEKEKRELEKAAESMRTEEDKLEEILEIKRKEKERKKEEKWRKKQEEKKRKEEEVKEEEEEGEEQDIMKAMGFKGFS
jgi:U4/U6.U5 tri-snRNP component SNU23